MYELLCAKSLQIASPLAGAANLPSGLLAEAQQGMQDDCTERGGANAVKLESTERYREVAGAKHQRDGSNDQILVVAEVYLVDHPNPGSGYGNQAEDHYRHTAQNRARDKLDQSAKFRRETQQDGDAGGDDKHQR